MRFSWNMSDDKLGMHDTARPQQVVLVLKEIHLTADRCQSTATIVYRSVVETVH